MATEIIVPTEQEGTKAVVKTWLKQVGDFVRINDPVVELETDKVAVEIAATSDGMLSEILIEAGAEVEPGRGPRPRIADGDAPLPPRKPIGESAWRAGYSALSEPSSRSTISTFRRASAQLLADISLERGRRAGERRDDSHARTFCGSRRRANTPCHYAPAVGVTRVPHDLDAPAHRRAPGAFGDRCAACHGRVRGRFQRHHRASRTRIRSRSSATAPTSPSLRISWRRCVAAMKAAPAVNGRWYDDRLEIYDDVNIGIGTALGEKGLIVPVIHRAQTLSLLEIAEGA